MFGDSVFDDDDSLTDRTESEASARAREDAEEDQPIAYGGLDERLRRQMAVAQLLREVGGC